VKERLPEDIIAMRAAAEFRDGDYINLGTGIPTLCAMFITQENDIFLQAEDGLLGYGSLIFENEWETAEVDLTDAQGRLVHKKKGMSCFDMDIAFDMIRGKHLDIAVLGALEVSERGDLANWTLGGIEFAGIGGSMDLAIGAKKVIITMKHTTKEVGFRIVKKCKYPLTAKECVDLIITDIAVIEVTEKGLLLKEVAHGWTAEEIQALTEPKLIIANDLKEMEF
jgi:3-oxoacid CoA-transferase B subunit